MLSRGDYNWSRTQAEETLYKECTYKGIGERECEIVEANATRHCNEYGVWVEPDTSNCYTEITQRLCIQRNVRTGFTRTSTVFISVVLCCSNKHTFTL